MPDDFLKLEGPIQREILNKISADQGKSASILEKDVWVCWALKTLFEMPDKKLMAFKGGTSLSKAYDVIKRFSEDIDVTIDYTEFGNAVDYSAPRNVLKNKSNDLRNKLKAYATDEIKPHFEKCLKNEFEGKAIKIDLSSDGEKLRIHYPTALADKGTYILDSVLIEFGGRNITEPNDKHSIKSYASLASIEDLAFPEAEVIVLSIERTFWEKVTLIHVACNKSNFESKSERLSRHWYDLALLYSDFRGKKAIKNTRLLKSVVDHKNAFFFSPQANYEACLEGKFNLVPSGEFLNNLTSDFKKMKEAKMFFEEPDFEKTLADILALQSELNEVKL